jgi:hypothetical protein
VSGWQPIETAPKDGRPILVFGENLYETARWSVGIIGAGWFNATRAYLRITPTHWHWLPAPPK